MSASNTTPGGKNERSAAPRGVEGLASFIALLAVLAATVGVVVFVNQLTQGKGSVPVVLTNPETPASAVELTGGTYIEPSSLRHVDLQVSELPMGLLGLTEASALAKGLLLAAVAFVVRNVLRDIAAAQPFTSAMPRRMGTLAGLALALGALPDALDTLAATAVLRHANLVGDSAPVTARFEGLPVDAMLIAALLGVLMQVFRHGRWLTGEVEGLV